ncbi:MAG: chromosome segregation protein SMC [Bacilli bacterium]|nr:chromosome segregation protein SMC [Bacilli bacterium]
MYLKCIRANGFKSFADKIEIDVNKGITGIVGPNGSGKSNILDAIRWVMGEQSVKALRGDGSMTDVIFAGSKSRNSSNRASVSLVFDNSDHYLNSEFNEIEIKRVVYKSGDNEYYLNNAKCRLKDITDLFLDSGAGKESFNIISQGAVADIINSKPLDRRAIFEEAAGVLKYKKRKEESYRKLDKTNENLARVNLLIDELLTTLEPLKEQRDTALKYQDYKSELESIEIALIASDIEKINNEYTAVKENVARLNREVEELDMSNSTDTSKVEQLKLLSMKLDTDIDLKSEELNKLLQVLADLQSKKQIAIERQKYSIDNDKLQSNVIQLKEEILNLNNSIDSLDKDVQDMKKDLEVKQLKSMDLIKVNEEKRKKKNDVLNQINNTNRDIMNLNNKIDILNDNINNDNKLPYSVKNVLNNIRLSGICGVLSKLIDIDEKYVCAIETSLGANSNVIVTEDEKSAKEAICYLKEQKLGRATFFPISVIKGRNINDSDKDKLSKISGFIGTADSLVSYDDKYKNIILNQLGNVLVVDNIDSLTNVAKVVDYRYKVVSLEGDVQYSGGALTGGASKNANSVMNQKFELERLKQDLEEKENSLKKFETELKKIEEEINKCSLELETNQRDTILITESYNMKLSNLKEMKNTYENKNNELVGTQNVMDNSVDKELDNILNEYYEKQALKENVEKELAKFKTEKSELSTEIASLEKTYREMNYQMNVKQNELKNEEIRLGKMDVRLDNLLVSLSENYSMTYEKAKMEYSLDLEEGTARQTVNNLKTKIKNLGEVNIGSIAEYERLNERYIFLSTQRDDLEGSVSSLLDVISEMDEIMKSRFVETFEKISNEFKDVFKKLFKGGDGVLELTEPDDILNTGIEISALPPGKKLNSIALLSGGEKTLTAIALLFAILNVKPVPFVVLDEVEAALDEANVDAFGSYLLSRKERSQFIIITHKKRTMEYADVLYGITMQESGVSKLVSVKLEG